ncbi:MAG: penicillin-binding protein 2 [Salinisphaera sp.]|nr:penicillin-binding protein 2 [Salinisphaera sp.]
MTADASLKNHRAERRLFVGRIAVAVLIMCLLTGVLLTRLAWLQIMQHEYYSLRSEENRTRVQLLQPVRGLIYDRNGVILAENLPAYRLEVIPAQVNNLQAAIDRLSRIMEIRSSDRERFFARVAQEPSYHSIPVRLNLSPREVAHFEVNSYRFPGMDVRAGLTRHYPLGKITAHLVGHVGGITAAELLFLKDQRYRGATLIGKTGVEDSYESLLHGYPGTRIVETNATGRPLRVLSESPPTSGRSIYLTIDAHLQTVAFRALGEHRGAVVAINPGTGAVLALVSKPSYNPNYFVGGISRKRYQALLHNPGNPLFNRALQGEYPPASTIKPMMALAALDQQTINPDKQVWCPGYITLPGSDRHWRDWLRSGHGWLNLTEAIYRSSDVYFYKLGLDLGIDAMHHYAVAFGLGHPTGIDLPGEAGGLMPSRAWKHGHRGVRWFPGETLNTAIGQGYVTATPLQLAQMAATIAQRGHAFQPHVLLASKSPGPGTMKRYTPKPVGPVTLDQNSYWELVIDAMEKVIHSPRGTAHRYVSGGLPYRMAGKSGTAQVHSLAQDQAAPDREDVARRRRDHALFIAFAPADDPRIAVAVVVEHGGGGSSTAGPIARQVTDAWLLGNRLVAAEDKQ